MDDRSTGGPAAPAEPQPQGRIRGFFGRLGPGLVTGAADDDPSGIGTHSQVGAEFGYGLAWTFVLSFPLMVVIQQVAAEIGRVTGAGIARNLRRHYSRPLLWSMVSCCWSPTSSISAPI
jgi:Mn2+/Fe2+ NRAMP family transporter